MNFCSSNKCSSELLFGFVFARVKLGFRHVLQIDQKINFGESRSLFYHQTDKRDHRKSQSIQSHHEPLNKIRQIVITI